MASKFVPGQRVATGIYWQADGSLSIRFSTGKRTSTGNYDIHVETFRGSVEEAKKRRAKLINDHAEGRLKPVDKHLSFGGYAEKFFKYNQQKVDLNKIALSTAEYYETSIRRNFGHLWDMPLARTSSSDIIDVFVELRKRGKTEHYMASIFGAFRAMWLASKRLKTPVPDLLDDVIAMLNQPLKKQRTVYTPEMFHQLLQAVEDDPISHGIITCSINSLCRINEVLALGKNDTDIDGREIVITRQVLKKRAEDGSRFGPHKTHRTHGPREIRMTDTLAEELKSLRPVLAAMQLRAGGAWQDNGLWFPTVIGTPQSYGAWEKRVWKKIFERTGLPYIRVHDIRHSAITYLLSEGVPLTTVADIAGHADIRTTMGYQHAQLNAQDGAMKKMDKAMGKKA